jgi:hypothetical protein
MSACVSTNDIYYLPTNKSNVKEYTTCGSIHDGYYINNFRDGSAVTVSIAEQNMRNSIYITLIIESPHTLRLTSDVVNIKDSHGNSYIKKIRYLSSSLAGSRQAMDLLVSLRDTETRYNVTIDLDYPSAESIWIGLPDILADENETIELGEVEMTRVEKSGFMTCIQ